MKFTKNMAGYLQPFDKEAVESLASMKVGQVAEVTLTAKARRPQRSARQNAYYWGVVLPYFVNVTEGSYSAEEFHYWLKCEIFGTKKIGVREVPQFSTTDLNTDQMEQYLKRCRSIGDSVFKMYIPEPNCCGYDY